MTTKAVYDVSGILQNVNYFSNLTAPVGGVLKLLKGNFKPVVDGPSGQLQRNTSDPLSPVHDLIADEMLKIIKEGLGGQEPLYYHLAADEVLIFRRDAASKKGGLNPAFNNISNGKFYAKIIEREIQRYKRIFGVSTSTPVVTKFVFWGDMVLPFGEGYCYYAESNNDESALLYLKTAVGTKQLIPLVWLYDYSAIPGSFSEFFLTNRSAVQKNLDRIKKYGFKFGATYATDGKLSDFGGKNITVDSDEKHVQHEIDMARNWCDFAQSTKNAGSFEGFVYTGWNELLRTNQWNGIFPLAYFGWIKRNARDLPSSCKEISTTTRGNNDQAVLKLLVNGSVPFVKMNPLNNGTAKPISAEPGCNKKTDRSKLK